MRKRYAIVESGSVTNLVMAESAIDANWIQSNTAKIGDAYNGSTFSEPLLSLYERKKALTGIAKSERLEKFYTNFTIPFPSDDKVIHFRNEVDRSNIRDKGFAAYRNVAAGNGSTTMTFKPAGEGKVTMTSLQLLTAFTYISAAKDVLWNSYGDVITAISDSTTDLELDTIEASWPA